MLRVIRRYTVTIICVLLAACFLLWWQSGRGINDNAMAGIPEFAGMDEKSILADEDVFAKLEPTYLSLLRNKTKRGHQGYTGS